MLMHLYKLYSFTIIFSFLTDLSNLKMSTFPNFYEPCANHIFDLAPKLVFLLSAAPDLNDGIFTNFSHEPTWRWYFAITPFEAFFLGIILTQFAVLNLLGIFPLNISGVLNGMGSGRRKRSVPKVPQRNRDIAGQLLKLMKKLDPDECSFKSICELEAFRNLSPNNYTTSIPQSITSVLLGLKQITKKRENGELSATLAHGLEDDNTGRLTDLQIPGIDKGEDDVIVLYETAVKIGDTPEEDETDEKSPCEKRYHRCPVTGEEILGYMGMMQSIDDLLQF